MPRSVALFASVASLALAITLSFTGCGSIETAPMPSAVTTGSGMKLTPNPPKIFVAPFDTTKAKWFVGREGTELVDFKDEFQNNFQHQLETRLTKLAPTEQRWRDLPDHGWLVAGEFITVDQGSRALRSIVGAGAGETTFQTVVYVYDLDVSKTQYVLSFRTGVPDAHKDTGAGSGSTPAGLSALGEPFSTATAVGSGLKLDTTRTCREIAAILAQYM